jgi:hypothetical protein
MQVFGNAGASRQHATTQEVLRDVEKRYSAAKEGVWISSVTSTNVTQVQRSSS